tara:strand:- start:4498 stop:4674 length:177 start_codon:yes stop_codon:yes gene_type:complete
METTGRQGLSDLEKIGIENKGELISKNENASDKKVLTTMQVQTLNIIKEISANRANRY